MESLEESVCNCLQEWQPENEEYYRELKTASEYYGYHGKTENPIEIALSGVSNIVRTNSNLLFSREISC